MYMYMYMCIYMYELAFLQGPNRGVSDVPVDHKQFIDHRTLLLHLADLIICFHYQKAIKTCPQYIYPYNVPITQDDTSAHIRYLWQPWITFPSWVYFPWLWSLECLCPNCFTKRWHGMTWHDMTWLRFFLKRFSHFIVELYWNCTFGRRELVWMNF